MVPSDPATLSLAPSLQGPVWGGAVSVVFKQKDGFSWMPSADLTAPTPPPAFPVPLSPRREDTSIGQQLTGDLPGWRVKTSHPGFALLIRSQGGSGARTADFKQRPLYLRHPERGSLLSVSLAGTAAGKHGGCRHPRWVNRNFTGLCPLRTATPPSLFPSRLIIYLFHIEALASARETPPRGTINTVLGTCTPGQSEGTRAERGLAGTAPLSWRPAAHIIKVELAGGQAAALK